MIWGYFYFKVIFFDVNVVFLFLMFIVILLNIWILIMIWNCNCFFCCLFFVFMGIICVCGILVKLIFNVYICLDFRLDISKGLIIINICYDLCVFFLIMFIVVGVLFFDEDKNIIFWKMVVGCCGILCLFCLFCNCVLGNLFVFIEKCNLYFVIVGLLGRIVLFFWIN